MRRAEAGRVGLDQDGLGRGQDVLLARQRLLEEQCLQGEHVLRAGELGEHRAGSHGPHGADLVNCGRLLRAARVSPAVSITSCLNHCRCR